MLGKLIKLQERFQPFLQNQDYTFIGPVDLNLLEPFMRMANELAPIVRICRETRDFLNNNETAIQALRVLPANTELRIYVVDGTSDDFLIHDTIENYCIRHNIEF